MRRTRQGFDTALRNSTRGDVEDLADSFYNLLSDGAVQPLTDGATISWDTESGMNASVTLTGNRVLSILNPLAGCFYTIRVSQDSTGSRTLSLPSPSKVVNGGAGAVTLTPTANAIDILTAYYDGTTYYWTYVLNFT